MNSNVPVIVVTGGNRGIGFEICRQLARRGAQVILTARKPEAGKEALAKLEREGLKAAFQPLEVTDEGSVTALRDYLENSFTPERKLTHPAVLAITSPGRAALSG